MPFTSPSLTLCFFLSFLHHCQRTILLHILYIYFAEYLLLALAGLDDGTFDGFLQGEEKFLILSVVSIPRYSLNFSLLPLISRCTIYSCIFYFQRFRSYILRKYYFHIVPSFKCFFKQSNVSTNRSPYVSTFYYIIIVIVGIVWSRINAAAAAAAAIAIASNSNEHAWQMSELGLLNSVTFALDYCSKIKLSKFWLATWDRSSNSSSLKERRFHALSLSIISKRSKTVYIPGG